MEKGRILIVEDESDILTALQLYFESQGYSVLTAKRGGEALVACRMRVPHLVLLDIKLPDVDGLQVFRMLRDHPRSRHVPIIFLTQKDERSDKLAGLELGADDYITKPFDVEEVLWRVEKSVRSAKRSATTHPVTNLPTGALIEEHLNTVKKAGRRGALLYFNLSKIDESPMRFNELLITLADMLGETLESYGTPSDFVGHVSDLKFIISTSRELAPKICRIVTERFNQELGQVVKLMCTQVQL
jgi:DNA-binding response OmpR family regulator